MFHDFWIYLFWGPNFSSLKSLSDEILQTIYRHFEASSEVVLTVKVAEVFSVLDVKTRPSEVSFLVIPQKALKGLLTALFASAGRPRPRTGPRPNPDHDRHWGT